MAERRPLVLVAGQLRELPTGDSLPGAGGTPVAGAIIHSVTSPGASWLPCDGAVYLRDSYPGLSAALPPTVETSPLVWTKHNSDLPSIEIQEISNVGQNGVFCTSARANWNAANTRFWRYDAGGSISFLTDAGSVGLGTCACPAVTADGMYFALPGGLEGGAYKFNWGKSDGTSVTKLSAPAMLPTTNCWAACWSPDGELLMLAGESGVLTLYRRSGDTLSLLFASTGGSTAQPMSAAWSSDGAYVAVTYDYKAAQRQLALHFVNIAGGRFDHLPIEGVGTGNNTNPSVARVHGVHPDLFVCSGNAAGTAAANLAGGAAWLGQGLELRDGGGVASSRGRPLVVQSSKTPPYVRIYSFADRSPRLIDVQSGAIDARQYHGAFTPDGKCVISVGEGTSKMTIGRADSAKLRVPHIPGAWIKS